MKAVVPVAGEGTRLRPRTAARPKCLVEVDGGVLLDHVLGSLEGLPVDEIVLVVGYRADDVVDHVGDAWEGIPVRYVEQAERLGLAHALLQAREAVDGTFVLLNGDNVFEPGLAGVLEGHRRSRADATVLVEPADGEAVETAATFVEDGLVTEIREHPEPEAGRAAPYRAGGFYVLPPAVFEACQAVEPSREGELEISDAVNHLVEEGARVRAAEWTGWRGNVNDEAALRELQAWVASRS